MPKIRDEKYFFEEKARGALKVAVAAGRLIRPEACQRCNRIPGRGARGQALIQGHHHDYSKPLDVEWLCAKCHRAETPLPAVVGGPAIGVRNAQSKLTDERVRHIRRLHATGLCYQEIANCFDVNQKTVALVVRRKFWTHVKDENEEENQVGAPVPALNDDKTGGAA